MTLTFQTHMCLFSPNPFEPLGFQARQISAEYMQTIVFHSADKPAAVAMTDFVLEL